MTGRKMVLCVFDFAARCLLAAVFAYAAWSKLEDPALFATVIASYRLVPAIFAGWAAIVLPPLEMLTALALLFTKWSRESALLMTGMLLVFLVGLTQAWARGLQIDCGCFGPSEPGAAPPLWLDILRDIGLLVASVWLTVRPSHWIFGRR